MAVIVLFGSMQARAVNAPSWTEFAKGEFVDSANVKAEGGVIAGYIRYGIQPADLYEVDCKADKIRVHSDFPRYVRVPVEGGGTVVQSDDGFRTVVPGSKKARIESAICGIATQAEAERIRKEYDEECQRALRDDSMRIYLAGGRTDSQLTLDERVCLSDLRDGHPALVCEKSGITSTTKVADYLHAKGIYLSCEADPKS